MKSWRDVAGEYFKKFLERFFGIDVKAFSGEIPLEAKREGEERIVINIEKSLKKFTSRYYNFSFESLENLLYSIEKSGEFFEELEKALNNGVNFQEAKRENYEIIVKNIQPLIYYSVLGWAILKIKNNKKFNSGVAWFSEKLLEHIHRKDKEILEKAWNIHPLFFFFVFILHRITHYKTSGRKGGKITERLSKQVFDKVYKYFLKFLDYLNLKTLKNLPENPETAYKIFQKYEPEDLFLEYLNINKK